MESFRDFEAGPDPFGRTWHVLLKWMQTGISLRGADTVDVKFILTTDGERMERTVAMRHPELLALSEKTGRPLSDGWCTRLAAQHLRYMVESGEDIDKDLVTVSPTELAHYSGRKS